MTEDRISELAARALDVMPGGVSHDGRQLDPLGLFIASADGARKTGVDGRSYIDFACGNGSVILGHGHRPSLAAATRAMAQGFHFSAGTEAEVEWAEMVRHLMPAAEQVRFTSSGNEACLLAFAVAQAVTGVSAILTLAGHYHGWAAPAVLPTLPLSAVAEIRPFGRLVLFEAPSVASAIDALASGRFAALILEPTGASFGKLPLRAGDVTALTTAAREAGTLSIFDETITGFRVAPGGAQQLFGLAPDLTVLGKILGGGLPCGALAGRQSWLRVLARSNDAPSRARVSHMGTGNGNPVVAALGTETLRALADGEAIARADAAGTRLRAGLNRLFAARGLAWAAYGRSSGFHLFLNPQGRPLDPVTFDPHGAVPSELAARDVGLINALRIALLAEGIDINPWPGGLLSAAHDADTIDAAVAGFGRAITKLAQTSTMTGWQRSDSGHERAAAD